MRKVEMYTNLLSSLLIFLFVYTALSKYSNLNAFIVVIHKSPLIGRFANVIALVIPAIELLISAQLFIPKFRIKGLYGSLVLMILFTIYIGYMLAFAPQLPCSCGGVISKMSWPEHLGFNIAVITLIIVAIFLNRHKDVIAINRHSRKPV